MSVARGWIASLDGFFARVGKNTPAGCVGLSPPRAKMARMVKKAVDGDEFGRALAKKGLSGA